MLKPNISQQRVIALLVQEQLTIPPQARVCLTVLVEIRGIAPATVAGMQIEYIAFAYVDEEPDRATTPIDNSQYYSPSDRMTGV